MLTAKHITTVDELGALSPAWSEIARRNRLPPFLTPEWFSACIRAYSQGKSLVTLAVYDENRLVGVAPLWSHATRHRGVPIRLLTFITCPDTPLADFVIDGPDPEPILALLHDYLFRADLQWDIARLSQWPSDSLNYRVFLRIASSRHTRLKQKTASVTPYVEIRDDWETFLSTRSPKYRKTHRNILNRIARLGGVTVEMFREEPSSILLEQIASVSSKGWKDARGLSISSSSDTLRFFAELTRTASDEGWLYVWLVKVGGRLAAMEYDLLADGRAYALRADYDPQFKDLSLGRYLEATILQHLFATNQLEYHTGPGLNAYKRHLTDQVRENHSVTLYRNRARGMFAWALETHLIPPLRRIRDTLAR